MRNCITFLLLFFSAYLNAQVPHITGEVNVSVKDGSMSCNFLLTNVPKIPAFTIWLNSGFNIQYFRDSINKNNIDYDKSFDTKTSYESFQYTLAGDTGITLPSSFRLKYTGKFPVINDTLTMYNRGDWKGNIAFNGSTVRASEQTAWYPILYDTKNDITIDKYTYNIKVTCENGKAIYLNGDNPKKGAVNNFSSSMPVSLLLYAGNFSFNNTSEINFLNAPLLPNQQQYLADYTKSISTFYEKKLNIPYGKNVSYIATTAVSKNNSWLFVTYPSIVVVANKNWSIKKLFAGNNTLALDTNNFQTIAHEMGHYYFGTLCTPNSTLRWMYLEGVTEYISLQYTRKNFGEATYKQALKDYVSTVKSFGKIIPISQIKTYNQIGEGYRYYYIPLLLTVLEQNIGINKTWQWLSATVNDKNVNTNYAYFKSSLLKIGMNEKDFITFEEKYINNDNAIENVIATALTAN